MDIRSAVGAVRFGLGRRPDDPVPADPAAWAERQIARPPAPQRALPGLAPPLAFADASALYHARATRERGDAAPQRAVAAATEADAVAWAGHCLTSDAPVQDRLTNFWANHLTVSRRVRNAGVFVGPMIRDVIRPLQGGRYADLLLAAVRHPGLVIYLGNGRSVGPNSEAGRRPGPDGGQRGLNENLAREILELHTLSPAGGYTQADVTEFARILTGWSTDRRPGTAGAFQFRPALHEPGPKTLLGRTFEEGEEGGVAALRFLADHPATHRHLAAKLARHFVADDPPRDAVERVAGVLRDTGGDLGAAARALVRLPQAWSPPLSKVRDPMDYTLAVGRALGLGADGAAEVARGMRDLGQPLWGAPQPNGWADTAAEWAEPEALMRRIEWAHGMAGRAAGRLGRHARGVAEAALGPLAAADTLREAARAGSPQDALTLVLASPEFQRR